MANFWSNLLTSLAGQNAANDPNKFMYNQPPTRYDTTTGQVKSYGFSDLLGDLVTGGLTSAYNAYNSGAGTGGQWLGLLTGSLGSAAKDSKEARAYKGFYDFKNAKAKQFAPVSNLINNAQSFDQINQIIEKDLPAIGNINYDKSYIDFIKTGDPSGLDNETYYGGKAENVGNKYIDTLKDVSEKGTLEQLMETRNYINSFKKGQNADIQENNSIQPVSNINSAVFYNNDGTKMLTGNAQETNLPSIYSMLGKQLTEAQKIGAGYNTTVNPQARLQQANAIEQEIINPYAAENIRSQIGYRNAAAEYMNNFKQDNTAVGQLQSSLNSITQQINTLSKLDSAGLKRLGLDRNSVKKEILKLNLQAEQIKNSLIKTMQNTTGLQINPEINPEIQSKVSNILSDY